MRVDLIVAARLRCADGRLVVRAERLSVDGVGGAADVIAARAAAVVDTWAAELPGARVECVWHGNTDDARRLRRRLEDALRKADEAAMVRAALATAAWLPFRLR